MTVREGDRGRKKGTRPPLFFFRYLIRDEFRRFEIEREERCLLFLLTEEGSAGSSTDEGQFFFFNREEREGQFFLFDIDERWGASNLLGEVVKMSTFDRKATPTTSLGRKLKVVDPTIRAAFNFHNATRHWCTTLVRRRI
ncbi:hypothetical protein NC652_032719 [Populus alba x Populus x berolinensis]|nr:hypothetical protein NC652_032719 [Populus alba x Populus x berolinensis]